MGHKLFNLTFLFSLFFEITAFSRRNPRVSEEKSAFLLSRMLGGEGGEGGRQSP